MNKDQIEKLSIEQQETLAEIELRLAQKRQILLQRARGHGLLFTPMGFGLLFFGTYTAFIVEKWQGLIWLFLFGLFLFTQVHAILINRRLDALIDLLGPNIVEPPSPRAPQSDR